MKPVDFAAMLLVFLAGPVVVAAFAYRSVWPVVPWLVLTAITLVADSRRKAR